MSFPEAYRAEIERFPKVLRELLAAELATGNEILEIGHSHPAPPVGAYVKLSRKVSTRPRRSGDGLDFYERQSSLSSGEFTDAKRFFFLLEPPDPPPGEIDMDAIRAERAAAERAEDARRERERRSETQERSRYFDREDERSAPPREPSLVARFRASMTLDFEKWKDGIGYDVALIEEADVDERSAIEALLLSRPVEDWRDVEALATLGTPRAERRLREVLCADGSEIALAVLRYAATIVSEADRARIIIRAIETADFSNGLSQALIEIESFHPPEIVDALLGAVLAREGTYACHFAAMLMFLHGRAAEPFDEDLRPYFLEFTTADSDRRRALTDDLRKRIGHS